MGLEIILVVAIIALTLVSWRSMQAAERLAGGSHREADRQRRDTQNSFEHYIEVLTTNDRLTLAQLHAQERMHHVATDAKTEQESIPDAPSYPRKDLVNVSPDGSPYT